MTWSDTLATAVTVMREVKDIVRMNTNPVPMKVMVQPIFSSRETPSLYPVAFEPFLSLLN